MILTSNDFWHKIKMYNFDPYNVFLAIDMTVFVLQGHRSSGICYQIPKMHNTLF